MTVEFGLLEFKMILVRQRTWKPLLGTVSACGALGGYCKFETLTKRVFEISRT